MSGTPAIPEIGASSQDIENIVEGGRASHNAASRTLSTFSIAAGLTVILPTRWSDQDRNKLLTISEDGRSLHFHTPSSTGVKEAAAARANHPIPPAYDIYYFEVTILDKGRKGHISVGFASSDVSLNRLPGWERDSWGYHGDDGNAFASARDGTPFGPRFTTGDVIGCGIDFTLSKAFYTKNGVMLGFAFEYIGRDKELYPAVGLRTINEAVKVNFGQDSFVYDISEYHDHHAQDRNHESLSKDGSE